MDQEERGAGQAYVTVHGTVPEDFGPETVTAWRREEARGWVTGTPAHKVLRVVDGSCPGNAFRKQMTAMVQARIPVRADRSLSITVVRHAGEVGYVERFKSIRDEVTKGTLPAAPGPEYIVLPSPYLDPSSFKPSHGDLVVSRLHRDKNGILVGWHQQEFPSCPATLRGLHYLRVPHWFGHVEVPFGALVELPPVQCYFGELLRASDPFAWFVFRTEWAMNCALYTLERARRSGEMCLLPRLLRTWIDRVGVPDICKGPGGVDEGAARDLKALMVLSDRVVGAPGLRSRLGQAASNRKDRASYVLVRFETRDGTWAALVDEDLAPLDLPYSTDILDAREFVGPKDGNVGQSDEIVPGSGSGGPGAPGVPGALSSGSLVQRDPALGSRTVFVANLLAHGEVPDEELRDLEGNLATSTVLGLRSFFGGSADVLAHAHVGPLLSASLHTTVNIGSRVAEWTRVQTGSTTPDYKGLLAIVDRNGIRGDLGSELATAEEEARKSWHGVREGSRVRGRDDMDQDTDPRAESRARYQ